MPPISFFVPGQLQNPLNGSLSHAHWSRKAKWARGWKTRTRVVWLHDEVGPLPDLHRRKRITFTAHVGALWDDDNLPAACKPARDALIGLAIHSDATTSGHEFVYRQVVDRARRGLEIAIEPLVDLPRVC